MSTERPALFGRCPADEPFRVFFPLATLLGISGVSLWPLYFSGLHRFYPGQMHSRLMVEGFLAGFIIGFLGTALPRLLAAPPLRRGQFWTLLGGYVLTAGLHIGEQPRAGDLAFIALMLGFGAWMVASFLRRKEQPPPGFVLVPFGYFSGLLGPAFWLAGLQGWVSGPAALFGALLLHQGFALFLLLGVGAYLLPRILGLGEAPEPWEEPAASAQWRRSAAFPLVVGFFLLVSYAMEALSPAAPWAAWLRASAAFAYLATMVPFQRQAWPPRTASLATQVGFLAVLAGLLFPLFWPGQRLAGLHIVFLGGFSLILFSVATRVVLGHAGAGSLLEKRLPSLQLAALLLLTGAVLRAVGDFLPSRPHWLSGASYLWMMAAGLWGFRILPKVRHFEPAPNSAEPAKSV